LAALGRNSAYVKVMQDDVAFLLKAADKQGGYSYLPSDVAGGHSLNSSRLAGLANVCIASMNLS
jgi:hypothetical protein